MSVPVTALAKARRSKDEMLKRNNETRVSIHARRHPAITLPLPPDCQKQSWKPQPSHLSREELRRIVLEIMG